VAPRSLLREDHRAEELAKRHSGIAEPIAAIPERAKTLNGRLTPGGRSKVETPRSEQRVRRL